MRLRAKTIVCTLLTSNSAASPQPVSTELARMPSSRLTTGGL